MTSNPSSRQFDSSTPRDKLSHDTWHNELLQLNATEDEDGDLGLRTLNEDIELELPPPLPSLLPQPIDSPHPTRPNTPLPSPHPELEDELTSHIRSAATMLAQLNSKSLPRADAQAIKLRILAEMTILEERRLALSIATDDNDTSIERSMVDKEDPSAIVFAEEWIAKRERIRRGSVWGELPGWELCSVIFKGDAEMEEVGSQFIFGLKRIWEGDGVDVWLRRYPHIPGVEVDLG
jgi:hypothetical protein